MNVIEKPYFYPSLILVFGLVAYANSTNNGFTFDDWPLIVHNPLVSQLDVGAIFSSPYWANHPEYGLYRPLTTLSYAVNRLVLGEGAFGFHLVNVVFHLVNGILVFYFLQFVIGRHGAGVGALLFLLHPIQTEAVNSVVGRAELLTAFCMLCGLSLYAKGRWVWAAVALFFGCLCKEHGIMLVGLFFCWDFWKSRLLHKEGHEPEKNVNGDNSNTYPPFPKGDYRGMGDLEENMQCFPYIIFVAVIILFLIVRYAVIDAILLPSIPQFIDNPLAHVSFWQRILTATAIVGKYTGLLFWPSVLSADYSFDAIPVVKTLLNGSLAFGVVICVLAFAGLALSFWGIIPSVCGLAIAFFIIPFFPVSNFLFPIGTIMAERLMYVPMVGMVMLVGVSFQTLIQWRNVAAVGVVVLMLLACANRTVMRNADWESNFTLFESAVDAVPRSAKAHFNLGHEMHDQSNWQGALIQYAAAIEIYSQYAEVHYNVGVLHQGQREGERAIQAYRRTIAIDSVHVNAWTNLGVILAEGEKLSEAIEAFAKVVMLAPKRIGAHYNLALTYQRSGQLDQAIESYRTVLKMNPTYDDAVFNLGILLERKRLPEEAIEAFLLVAKQPGRQGDLALFAAGRLYVQLGEKENAKKVLESFLNRWKGEGAVRQNAERLLRQLNID